MTDGHACQAEHQAIEVFEYPDSAEPPPNCWDDIPEVGDRSRLSRIYVLTGPNTQVPISSPEEPVERVEHAASKLGASRESRRARETEASEQRALLQMEEKRMDSNGPSGQPVRTRSRPLSARQQNTRLFGWRWPLQRAFYAAKRRRIRSFWSERCAWPWGNSRQRYMCGFGYRPRNQASGPRRWRIFRISR